MKIALLQVPLKWGAVFRLHIGISYVRFTINI